MANAIDFSQFTFTADEVRSLNEVILKKVTECPLLNTYATIYTGIRNDRQIGLADPDFGLIGKAAQGCDPTYDTNQIGTQQKKWAPKRIEFLLELCWKDLDATFGQLLRKLGINVEDLTSTEYMAWVQARLEYTLPRMIFRHFWFGDTAAANVDDSPAGVITSGVDVDYFNVIDGIFVQLGDLITATPARRTSLNAYNGQATYALQKSSLTNQLAYEAFLAVRDDAPSALRSQADQIIICTEEIGRKAMRYVQSQGLPYEPMLAIDGLIMNRVDGVSLAITPLFDDYIHAYEDNGTKYNNPHRIVYTTVSNLAAGIEGSNLFDTMDIFHDKKSRHSYIETSDAFDAKIIQDNLFQYGV